MRSEYEGLSEDTQRLLSGRETVDAEFKQGLSEVTAEYFVAFANANGGTILLGVSPDKRIMGITKGDDEVRRDLLNKADTCHPSLASSLTIHEERTLADKRIYRIGIVEGQDKPYCTNSGLYKIREDVQNRAIFPDEMRRIILSKSSLRRENWRLNEQNKRLADALKKSAVSEDQIRATISSAVRGF